MKRKNSVRKNSIFYATIIIFLFLVVIGGYAFKPGKEFQVNTYTEKNQLSSKAAMNIKGNFVVVWMSDNQDGSERGIFAQRFNKKGNPLGSEFQVNTYTNMKQETPAAAMDKKGNFVIAWRSEGQDGSSYGIFAQRFDKNGQPVGSEFQVNTHVDNWQSNPTIAMDKKGNFVIAWHSDKQDSSYYGIFAQRFSKKGKPLGSEFQVNTYTKNQQWFAAIAMDEKGNFIIVWASEKQDGSNYGIFAQRFNNKGNPLGPEFQVNTYTKGLQSYPTVAMDKKGNVVIVWQSDGQDGSDSGIFAQRYNSKGKALGSEFQVNTYTENYQRIPTIAMDANGNFVIAWYSNEQDGQSSGIFAQRYNSKGKAIGSEFQVNTLPDYTQSFPSAAMDKRGNFVVSWTSSIGRDGSGSGIFARMFKR